MQTTALVLALLPLLYPLLILVTGLVGGYIIGAIAARFVVGMLRRNLGKLVEETGVGESLRRMGIDVFNLIGGLVKAFVFSLAFLASVEHVGPRSEAWRILYDVAVYLPRLIGGVAVLILGLVLATALSRYTSKVLSSVLGAEGVTKVVETMLALSLLVVVVTIALNLLLLNGDIFYPLMLGIIMIGIGIYMGDFIVESLVKKHSEFSSVAPFAKFTIYMVFVTTGLAAIFARFPTVASTVSVLAWGVVATLVLTTAPLVYRRILEARGGLSGEKEESGSRGGG